MNSFDIMGLLSTAALLTPVALLIAFRLGWYKNIIAFFIYSIIALSFNIFSLGYIPVSESFVQQHSIFNNLLDVPLMLFFLIYFITFRPLKKAVHISLIAFVLFELAVLSFYGFTKKTTNTVLVPGLAMVMLLSIYLFVRQVKITVVNNKTLGKLLMITSVVFAYAGYCFLFVFFYLLKRLSLTDANLMYFLLTLFSSLLMSAGLITERRRVGQLREIEQSRRELRELYGEDEKGVAPKERSIALELEKREWQ
ncbi:MAG TPA: hypothetical protein PKC69_02650 [Chitinophagaceae bacterium]|nr:hypothetical protein [Chitinophagaceae bacterium]